MYVRRVRLLLVLMCTAQPNAKTQRRCVHESISICICVKNCCLGHSLSDGLYGACQECMCCVLTWFWIVSVRLAVPLCGLPPRKGISRPCSSSSTEEQSLKAKLMYVACINTHTRWSYIHSFIHHTYIRIPPIHTWTYIHITFIHTWMPAYIQPRVFNVDIYFSFSVIVVASARACW